MSAYRNASRSQPCPVCQRPDQCRWPTDNPDRVLCYRVESGREVRTKDGRIAWSHDIGSGPSKPYVSAPDLPTVEPMEIVARSKKFAQILRTLHVSDRHSDDLLARGPTVEQIERNAYRSYGGGYISVTGLDCTPSPAFTLRRVATSLCDARTHVSSGPADRSRPTFRKLLRHPGVGPS
jgi:hypothetical protein